MRIIPEHEFVLPHIEHAHVEHEPTRVVAQSPPHARTALGPAGREREPGQEREH
jgi:hypothetical protein